MYDGCLESKSDGFCSKCLEGAYLSSYGLCNKNYLNCLKVSETGKCVECAFNYALEPKTGKCYASDPHCKDKELKSGLCLECEAGFEMIGYSCIKQAEKIQNCFLMSENLESCSYCKPGYKIFYGKCYLPQQIKASLQGPTDTLTCSDTQYFNPMTNNCSSLPRLCLEFDYGLLKC